MAREDERRWGHGLEDPVVNGLEDGLEGFVITKGIARPTWKQGVAAEEQLGAFKSKADRSRGVARGEEG